MKFSIIVPIYNVEMYLRKCLDSIKDQSFSDFECILVDDGSPDNSGNICDEFISVDRRFKVIHKTNGGLSRARNIGIENATGEYVYFLDSDDFLDRNAFSILVNRMQNDNLQVLKFSSHSFYGERKDESTWGANYKYKSNYEYVQSGRDFLKFSLDNEDLIVSNCLFIARRSLIEKTGIRFIEGIIHEDNSFYFQLLWHADRVGVLNEPLYFRRYRVGSIMTARNYRKTFIGYVTALISINNTRCTSEDFDKYCRHYIIRYISVTNSVFSHLSLSEYKDLQVRQMINI